MDYYTNHLFYTENFIEKPDDADEFDNFLNKMTYIHRDSNWFINPYKLFEQI